MTTDPGDLVLDPTCGSGTTAYVAEQWGRRWITIDTSRVALALARTRLMSARFPYYLLADSPEGRQKEQEILGLSNVIPANFGNRTPKAAEGKPAQAQVAWESNTGVAVKAETDIKKGFVYKRVPHVTLKAIANNPEIDTIHEKWQQQLEPIRTQLNQLLKQAWEDWQVPRDPDPKWSQQAKDLLTQWWSLRQQRQQEIDGAIARNADTEILYDQPYEDTKRLRVTGPFTVESLSPHRVLSADEERPTSEADGQQQASDQFETRIIENLRKAGVQNTVKQERLKFDSLEPHPGTWIHATGEYTDADGKGRRVAVSLGPEYGTVSADDIREAAKEAVQGIGYDLLIICGFAFDPSVPEEAKRYGKLTVLPTRMNSDLLLGDELLKKTGSANLFIVFGEPDIEIEQQDDKVTVTLHGLDIYDPTTGEIRSHSTDDIACWFIDTHYNGESFFVRHAYFTGADQPYDKLKRALKAEIDESAWSDLYSTTSRPFDSPSRNGKPGKIAVKVINHYGDEVLKVYEMK
jgi:adenine-specific DNA-methyltransferase